MRYRFTANKDVHTYMINSGIKILAKVLLIRSTSNNLHRLFMMQIKHLTVQYGCDFSAICNG